MDLSTPSTLGALDILTIVGINDPGVVEKLSSDHWWYPGFMGLDALIGEEVDKGLSQPLVERKHDSKRQLDQATSP